MPQNTTMIRGLKALDRFGIQPDRVLPPPTRVDSAELLSTTCSELDVFRQLLRKMLGAHLVTWLVLRLLILLSTVDSRSFSHLSLLPALSGSQVISSMSKLSAAQPMFVQPAAVCVHVRSGVRHSNTGAQTGLPSARSRLQPCVLL